MMAATKKPPIPPLRVVRMDVADDAAVDVADADALPFVGVAVSAGDKDDGAKVAAGNVAEEADWLVKLVVMAVPWGNEAAALRTSSATMLPLLLYVCGAGPSNDVE